MTIPFTTSFRKPTLPLAVNILVFLALCLPSFFIFVASVVAATPVINNVVTSNLLTTGATVSWTTDIPSTTQIEYGTTTAYGSSTTLNSSLVTNHSQNITGLQANQLYNYRVKSRDASGDLATSGNRTFITPLGTTTAGSATDSSNSNGMNTTRFTTIYGGKVASLSVHVGAVDAQVANRSFQLALYTASGNVPGTLIASSTTGTLVANTWNSVPITATLAPGTAYFIAYNTNGTSDSVNNMHYISGGTSGWKTGGQAFGSWPASFGSFSTQSATFSLYATFVSDMTAPTVAITAPADASSVSGQVSVTADAADDTAVSSVQFKLNGNNLGAADTTAPYSTSWDTLPLVNGPQTLTAVASDAAGNLATSTPVTVTVNNPAKVTINQPTAGQNIASTSVTVVYTKSGDWVAGDGKHAHLRLDDGSTVMDFDTDQDHSYTFLNVPGGAHTIEAVVASGSHVEDPTSGGTVSFSTTAPDVIPPTVSLTAPADSATVQNNVTVTADAADDNAVVGVQFLLDGNNLGSEDTTAPYSTSWNTTTTTNGTHSLTARARDSLNQTTSVPVSVNVQNTDPRAVTGEWSSVMNWPLVSVHATMMYTGKVLMWDAWESPTSNAKVWDPSTNTFADVPVASGLFCSGQATTADGKVLVMGGHTPNGSGIKDINLFDPATQTWAPRASMANMQTARWYPSVTQLPDNRMVSFSGQVVQGTYADTPEVYNPKTNVSTSLPISTPQLHEIQYPQTSILPSGKVLAISAEHGSMMLYNPATNGWTNVGTSQVPVGAWTSIAPGKYLITGGATGFNVYVDGQQQSYGTSQKTTRILDMTNDTPVWTTVGNMNQGRSFHNVTMLPDGKALAIGGANIVTDFAPIGNATLTAETFDPATNSWTQMANPAIPRMYHSISMLLPDGRVLSSGGGRLSPAPDEPNAQIFSPPYLFKGVRPTITSAPSNIAHNSTMDIVSPEAADISKVTFVNLGSITHTADWNQHFMDLSFTRNGNTLTVNTPANANLAPENYYMIFLVNSNGVPSVAKIVKLGVPDTTAPVVSNIQATNIGSVSATVSWTTDELADTQIEYGTDASYGSSTTLNAALILDHSQNLSGLSPNTVYHYLVKSRDGSGNLVLSGDNTFTTSPVDAQAPIINLTAPAAGSTVSGSVNVTANASDNIGVIGVQFKLDGVNLGSEDTTAPYSVSWATTQSTNGSHTLTAVARDAAGNTTTATTVTVNVQNTVVGGLVGAWGFNEGSGSVLPDLSGNGNNGTIFQAVWTASGKYGSALTFDGSNDYVSIPDANSLDFTNKLTLEAWVRPTSTSGWRTVMLKENGSELAYAMYSSESANRPSGWIRVTGTSGSSQSTGATPGLTANAWTHMATTYDGTTLKLYINGTLRATKNQTGNLVNASGALKFGGNAVWGEFFAGQLDEIRLYNRALTQTEIQTDMNLPL